VKRKRKIKLMMALHMPRNTAAYLAGDAEVNIMMSDKKISSKDMGKWIFCTRMTPTVKELRRTDSLE
jgi:hypothetical protein